MEHRVIALLDFFFQCTRNECVCNEIWSSKCEIILCLDTALSPKVGLLFLMFWDLSWSLK